MRKRKTPALVNLAIYTTITIFLWIFFDIYRALKKAPVLDINEKLLEPVNPNLDNNLLDEIYQRIYYNKSTFQNIAPTQQPSDEVSSPSGELSPTATPEITITVTPTEIPTTTPVIP